MKKINMNILQYNFDEEGNILSIDVSFQRYDNINSFNGRINIKQEMLGDVDLRKLNKEQLDIRARALLRDWIMQKDDTTEDETE